ncbi:MAG TPA: SurA N-terminal domain-containing protein [Gammaproteobacteria bacterium]|nr:SurA N-terminal domain-containing protein [Gammaproteobacteria bacterium]
MLQRIHDSLAKWVAFVLLALVSVGFIFWRADFNTGRTATFAAKVNGESLSLTEFDRELQAQQNQYQQQYRTELSDDLRRALRRKVVENMISEAVLKQRAEEQGYRVSIKRLSDYIHSIPAFQVDNKFDENVYRNRLTTNGITQLAFELQQRDALAVADLEQGIADSTFLTPAEFRRYIELFNQRREIGYALFPIEAFLGRVTVDEPAIAAHYESNQAKYQTTETVDLEYVELSLADIAAAADVSDEALRAAYDEEKERFQTMEERHARQILVTVEKGDEEGAKAKAAAIAERARKGEDFAKLAKELSADVGTKAQGGDVGWMTHSSAPFEDALFAMQAGAISDPVKTDFGYHVIKLEEIRPATVRPFEAVRDELATDLKTRKAEQGFYDRANRLADRSFDAYNELATVATELNLPLKTLMGFPRTGDPAVFPNSAPVVQAAFDEQNLDTGRNSSLVELGDDQVIVLRVTAHHVATTKPLADVHDQIRDELKRDQAQQLAEQAASAFLQGLQGAGADPAKLAAQQNGTWTAPAPVERTNPSIPTEVLAAAFRLAKPAQGEVLRDHVALANGNHAVLVLSSVQAGTPESVPQSDRDQRQRQLADQAAYAELTGYVGSLREQATVRIPEDVLEPQQY